MVTVCVRVCVRSVGLIKVRVCVAVERTVAMKEVTIVVVFVAVAMTMDTSLSSRLVEVSALYSNADYVNSPGRLPSRSGIHPRPFQIEASNEPRVWFRSGSP